MTRKGLWILLAVALACPAADSPVLAQRPQGITVQGHWELEVRDPDGGLVSRQEFDNHLFNSGRILSEILARTRPIGEWRIVLEAASNGTSPFGGVTINEIREPSGPPLGFRDLDVRVEGNDLVLQGNTVAIQHGTVTFVRTYNHNSDGLDNGTLTGTAIVQELQAKQTLNVKVTLRFSTASSSQSQ